jgi:hypothetical protein
VKGDKTVLQPGMMFSNEPTICIYGEFGVRLEDHMVITETGARWFTQPAHSVDDPSRSPLRQGRRLNIARFGAESGGLRDQLERAQPQGMVIDIGHDHEFVGAGLGNERVDA